MKFIILCLGMLWCVSTTGNAETIVSFDPATVSLGESAQLIFSSDQPLAQAPDLSALQGSFAVAGQQQSMQTVTINGHTQTKHALIFNVFPRRSGTLTTDGITVDGKSVPSAKLTVLEGGDHSAFPVSFEAHVNTDKAYPEETILYTVRLVDGAGLLTGQMSEPKIENAHITVLDMDKTWTEKKDGKPVRLFERTFAVTPEKEGYLTIPPMELYGSVAVSPDKRSSDLFEQGFLFNGLVREQRNVRLETNSVQINVLKKPTGWKGWWLPSTQVNLSAKDNFPKTISVGSSLTRVIRLTAIGVEAERLPVIVQPGNQKLNVYPSPEQRTTIQTPVGDVQGTEEISIIIVPKQSGKITIPAIHIPWFNTRTHKTEEAVLPAKTIVVQPGANQPTEATRPTDEKKTISLTTPKTTRKETKTETVQNIPNDENQKLGLPWVIGLTILGVLGGLGLGFLLFHHRKHHKKSYRIPTDAEKKPKKKKKPLPDLYPF